MPRHERRHLDYHVTTPSDIHSRPQPVQEDSVRTHVPSLLISPWFPIMRQVRVSWPGYRQYIIICRYYFNKTTLKLFIVFKEIVLREN
ncbi:hypothetical protein DPMN_079797 [Dreissena polymorpha]|uniref:Uncharacterized protein n=1 Tax=Dreissena polymorpha TaxID=45954 RepID=A0A9D3YRF0_DREPO|nr:hypothetical protein DPMN_079797 [Dreissena polymorpha]